MEQLIADAILQKPVKIEITYDNLDKWQKLRLKPRKRTFVLKPLHPCTVIKISPLFNLLLGVNIGEKITIQEINSVGFGNMEETMPILVKIVGHALNNKKEDPPDELFDFINCNGGDKIYEVLAHVYNKTNVLSFITTIISLRGMSLISGETIAPDKEAPGHLSGGSRNISDAG
jgi:hypothetical protein